MKKILMVVAAMLIGTGGVSAADNGAASEKAGVMVAPAGMSIVVLPADVPLINSAPTNIPTTAPTPNTPAVAAPTGDIEKITNAALTNKYWKLVELNGKPLTVGDSNVHLTFRDGGKVDGSLGCNNFTGVYELSAPERLKFLQVVATQKMCLNGAVMDIERDLAKVLSVCDSYRIGDDGKLMLIRARMAPLAVFEVVYMK